jgi:hypothetical protein
VIAAHIIMVCTLAAASFWLVMSDEGVERFLCATIVTVSILGLLL